MDITLFPYVEGPNKDKWGLVCGKLPLSQLLENWLENLTRNLQSFLHDKIFEGFMKKFEIMAKESLICLLRNWGRQRQGINRYFMEFGYLISEAVPKYSDKYI